MKTIRKRSGEVDSDDPLVSFLYVLLRDHVQPGIVEEILLKQVPIPEDTAQFSNGWLARYAQDIAERLRKR